MDTTRYPARRVKGVSHASFMGFMDLFKKTPGGKLLESTARDTGLERTAEGLKKDVGAAADVVATAKVPEILIEATKKCDPKAHDWVFIDEKYRLPPVTCKETMHIGAETEFVGGKWAFSTSCNSMARKGFHIGRKEPDVELPQDLHPDVELPQDKLKEVMAWAKGERGFLNAEGTELECQQSVEPKAE